MSAASQAIKRVVPGSAQWVLAHHLDTLSCEQEVTLRAEHLTLRSNGLTIAKIDAILKRLIRGRQMSAHTPHMTSEAQLAPLDSRYVAVSDLPWKPTPTRGIDMKILLLDEQTGLMTALFRWEPGTELPLHEHVEIEQTYVLQGSIVDDEGEVREGDYVWRPQGNRHIARSPNGALVLSMFLKPNRFLVGELAGKELK